MVDRCKYELQLSVSLFSGFVTTFPAEDMPLVAGEMCAMDDAMIVLHLHFTQAELSSLLMAQINQARRSRLTQGRDSLAARTDLSVLEKLVAAQRAAAPEALAD